MELVKSKDVDDATVLEISKIIASVAAGKKKRAGAEDSLRQAILAATDKHLVQLKHCSRRIADRVLALLEKTNVFSGTRLKLTSAVA